MNIKSNPNLDHTATAEEVRASMLHWFGEMMPEYTVEQWRTFKAMLYPEPLPQVRDSVDEPDYEAMHEARLPQGPPNSWGS